MELENCTEELSMRLFLHISLIPAVLIAGVLSFLQRRDRTLAIDRRLPCLGGRFGIVVPLDTVGSLSNRWSYGFAFGAVSSTVLMLFSDHYVPFTVPSWAKPILYLIGALEVGLAYFPFFACLSTPFRAAGAMLGILYSVAWITVTIWDMAICPDSQIHSKYEKIIVEWPRLLSLSFLLGRFVFILVKSVRIRLNLEQERPEELSEPHQVQHVRSLLRKTPVHSQAIIIVQLLLLLGIFEIMTVRNKPLSWFQRRVYEWDPYFKFPNRLIGTAVISIIGLYMVTVTDYIFQTVLFENSKKILEVIASNQTNVLGSLIPLVEEFIYVARNCMMASTIFAILISVAYIFHVLACYRKHLKRLWKGKKGFLPEKFHNPRSSLSVASIARYSGWQIAFTLWGYLIVRLVIFCLSLLFAYLLVIPLKNGEALRVFSDLGIIILTIGLVVALVILQVVLVDIFFLQDKMSPTDKHKPLALNNRKAFDCFNYFFFFYNVVVGISRCMLRLLSSLMVGTWLISRIDRTIMPRGFEGMDTGYITWIGMIFADHYHNSPTMVCFCQLLISNSVEKQTASAYSILTNTPSETPVTSRARRRWMLIYTLQRNPHLILLRKHHLSSPSSLQTSSSPLLSDTVVQAWVKATQRQNNQAASQSPPEIIDTQAESC